MRIKETEKREAIWVKNRCKFRADDKQENELVNEVKNLNEKWEKETVSFQTDNWTNSRVSWTDEADEKDDWAEKMINFQADNKMNFQETVEADEVELDHSDQTSFQVCCRVIFHLYIQCISFKSSSSLSSFEWSVSSWAICLT